MLAEHVQSHFLILILNTADFTYFLTQPLRCTKNMR